MKILNHSNVVWTVAFHPDGKHLLGGSSNGIRRWRLADGQEVGNRTGMRFNAISVSRNGKWIVCGATEGASVWNGELDDKIIDVDRGNTVYAVDVSPDSARFATGTNRGASIWSITSGERLVGPLDLDYSIIVGIRFSPPGERVATACVGHSIQIFNSNTGDKLVNIAVDIPPWVSTPLAWSSDGHQIFATSLDKKIKSFDTSTGSLLAQSQILHDGNENFSAIVLAADNKFIATIASNSPTSFLDTLTLSQIGPVIEDSAQPFSIAISQDRSYLALGRQDGKIVIRDLNQITPVLSPKLPTREEVQDRQPSTSGGHDNKLPNSESVGFCHLVIKRAALTPSLCTYNRKKL